MKGALQDVVRPRVPVPGASSRGEHHEHTASHGGLRNVRQRCLLLCCIALFAGAAPASAAVPHTVQPGETLWSIAAANNLTTRTVAAYNGLSEDAQVVLGSTILVPTTVEGYAALQQAGLVPADPAEATAPTTSTTTAAAPAAAPAPQGAYTVRTGDTLSALAAQTGTTVEAMA